MTMRNIGRTVTLTLALLTPALGAALLPTPPAVAAKKMKATAPDRQKLLDHLEQHQQYPATRAQLLASCKDLVDFTDGEKRWFVDRLPEGNYKSAAEVMKVVWKD
jgi:hypothetical protein